MIAVTDIANILYGVCPVFGLDVYQKGNIPDERKELSSERVIIYTKPLQAGEIWNKCYVEVNLCVPDMDGVAGLIRLQELERLAHEVFDDGVTGLFDGTAYYYSPDSIGIEEDTELRCHYVNVRILFEVLND